MHDATRETSWGRGFTGRVRAGIRQKPKSCVMLHEESEEAIVPITGRTTQPATGKGLYFNDACVRG